MATRTRRPKWQWRWIASQVKAILSRRTFSASPLSNWRCSRRPSGELWSEGSVRIAHVGGVFQSAILLDRFRTLITLDGDAQTEAPRRSPAAGALILAYKLAGLPTIPHPLPGVKS